MSVDDLKRRHVGIQEIIDLKKLNTDECMVKHQAAKLAQNINLLSGKLGIPTVIEDDFLCPRLNIWEKSSSFITGQHSSEKMKTRFLLMYMTKVLSGL